MENEFQNVVYKMVIVLSWSQLVKNQYIVLQFLNFSSISLFIISFCNPKTLSFTGHIYRHVLFAKCHLIIY